jgi:hypothetical protein
MYDKVEMRLAHEGETETKARKKEGKKRVDWKRKWRVKKAVELLKQKYKLGGLRARVALVIALALGVISTIVLEAAGRTGIILWIQTAADHVAQIVLGALAALTALVPAAGFAMQSHREASTSRGVAIFEQAKSVKDHLGFMSKVKSHRHLHLSP